MYGGDVLAFLALLGLGGQGGGQPEPLPAIPPMPGPVPPIPGLSPVIVAPPYPSAIPPDLPPFPDGWEYDEPVSAAVGQRAAALLSSLWAQGEGAHTAEMTAGHWVTYRAEIVAGGKHGVTAWRVKAGLAPAVAPAFQQMSPSPTLDVSRRVTVPPVVPAAPSQQQGAGRPTTPSSTQIPIIPAVAPVPSPAAIPVGLTPAQNAAHQMNQSLMAHGYKQRDQDIYRAFQRSIGARVVDGFPGTGTMTALGRALVTMGEAMAPVRIYPWKSKPGTSGYDGVNAPTLAEWTGPV